MGMLGERWRTGMAQDRTMRIADSTGGLMAKQRSGKVRIIAGRWRHRQLPVVSQPAVRPTPDRVRETVAAWESARELGKVQSSDVDKGETYKRYMDTSMEFCKANNDLRDSLDIFFGLCK